MERERNAGDALVPARPARVAFARADEMARQRLLLREQSRMAARWCGKTDQRLRGADGQIFYALQNYASLRGCPEENLGIVKGNSFYYLPELGG